MYALGCTTPLDSTSSDASVCLLYLFTSNISRIEPFVWDGCMDGWMYVWMDVWMYVWMYVWMDVWMDVWM